jgi:hypothetical protein
MDARAWERPVAVEGVREGKPAGHFRCRVVLHVRFMRRERGNYEIAEKGMCALGAVTRSSPNCPSAARPDAAGWRRRRG